MDKIKVLFLSIFYPLFMGRYFLRSLQDRDDVDLRTAGVYTGTWIPWLNGLSLDEKYALKPDYVIDQKPGLGVRANYDQIKVQFDKGWLPDIVITVDGGINWSYKPVDGVVVTVATDAHCVDYSHARSVSDKFFNMHYRYSEKGDLDLPYAFSSQYMYPMPEIEKDADAVLIGMPYPQRVDWVSRLRERNLKVLFENGPILDEYRELNNRARVGLNWASLEDLNCRVFELMSMKLCPVINHVPDLDRLGFVDGEHYIGFDGSKPLSGVEDATHKVMWAVNNPSKSREIAEKAYNKVIEDNHTYDNRVDAILKECGYA